MIRYPIQLMAFAVWIMTLLVIIKGWRQAGRLRSRKIPVIILVIVEVFFYTFLIFNVVTSRGEPPITDLLVWLGNTNTLIMASLIFLACLLDRQL